MFLAEYQRLLQNLTIENLYVHTLHGDSLKVGLGNHIENGGFDSHYLQMRRLLLKEALDTHTYRILGCHILGEFLAILVIELTDKTFDNPVDAVAHLALGQDLFSFGISLRHEDAFQDVQLIVRHRTISSCQFTGNVSW